jgi:hypothetical protein
MQLNAFIGKTQRPTDDELAAALGPVKKLWDELAAEMPGEWKSSSPKNGWALRLKKGERNIVYLSPGSGCFLASFALGDKAMRKARESGLPASIVRILDTARRYAEGSAVRVSVKKAEDVAAVRKLMAAKIAN